MPSEIKPAECCGHCHHYSGEPYEAFGLCEKWQVEEIGEINVCAKFERADD